MSHLVKDVLKIPKNKHVLGMLGVEVEVEGENLPTQLGGWRVENDGSLKADDSKEYVFERPLDYDVAVSRVNELYTALHKDGTAIHDSYRAGVHVHINVQDYTMMQLFTFMTSFILFEQLLVRYCGEFREGNHFCLRSTDAPFMIKTVCDVISTKDYRKFHTDEIRYSAMNLMALGNYGSLEFRSMRTTQTPEAIVSWINLLLMVKNFSERFDTPADVIRNYSEADLLPYLDDAFGVHAELLNHGDVEGMLKTGMRSAQEIAYCTDWATLYDAPEKTTTNIFASVLKDAYRLDEYEFLGLDEEKQKVKEFLSTLRTGRKKALYRPTPWVLPAR